MSNQEQIANLSRLEELQMLFAGRKTPQSNGPGFILITGTTHATPGTEVAIAHTSGRIPTGMIPYNQDKAGSLYEGDTANTATAFYVKSDIASVTFKAILVFA